MQKFTPIFITYATGQQIPTNCNSITFINYGTSICYIDNVTLQPNQSFEINGNACEYMDTTLSVRFEHGLQNNLTVVKKVFA
jgi:hypothetical protein